MALAAENFKGGKAPVKKDPRVYLAQILERIERILQYTAGGKAWALQYRTLIAKGVV